MVKVLIVFTFLFFSIHVGASYQDDPNNCGHGGHVCKGEQPYCHAGSCYDLSLLESCGPIWPPQKCASHLLESGRNENLSTSCRKTKTGAHFCFPNNPKYAYNSIFSIYSEKQCSYLRPSVACSCANGEIEFGCGYGSNAAEDCNQLCQRHATPYNIYNPRVPNYQVLSCTLGGSFFGNSLETHQKCAAKFESFMSNNNFVPCPANYASCDGKCVFMQSDTQNCGDCGLICPTLAPHCHQGRCVE